jgi:hypothetical protein
MRINNGEAPRKPRKPRAQQVQRSAPDGWQRPAGFAKRHHIGLNQVYAAVRNGELDHVKLGGTIFIPDDALERRLARTAR